MVACIMELLSKKKWRLISAQLSVKFCFLHLLDCFVISSTQPASIWEDISIHLPLAVTLPTCFVKHFVRNNSCFQKQCKLKENCFMVKATYNRCHWFDGGPFVVNKATMHSETSVLMYLPIYRHIRYYAFNLFKAFKIKWKQKYIFTYYHCNNT